jgi:hypothetical protein
MIAVGSPAGAATGPDLAPTAITFDPAKVVANSTVHFDSGVVNTGDAESGVFNIKWLVDNHEVGAYGSHASVPAGATVLDGNSQFDYTFPSAGSYIVEFRIDVDGHVAESNENNNTTSVTVAVPDAAGNGNGNGTVSPPFVCVRGPNGGCNGTADPGAGQPDSATSDEQACAAKVGPVAGDPTKVTAALGSPECLRAFQASIARGGRFLTTALQQAVCTPPTRAIVFGNGANPELEKAACGP